eukprot:3027631-Pyramimonas_sp.AAC.1
MASSSGLSDQAREVQTQMTAPPSWFEPITVDSADTLPGAHFERGGGELEAAVAAQEKRETGKRMRGVNG